MCVHKKRLGCLNEAKKQMGREGSLIRDHFTNVACNHVLFINSMIVIRCDFLMKYTCLNFGFYGSS